jgi:hypothetical protein
MRLKKHDTCTQVATHTHTYIQVGTSFYILCGWTKRHGLDIFLNDVFVYDVENDIWSPVRTAGVCLNVLCVFMRIHTDILHVVVHTYCMFL